MCTAYSVYASALDGQLPHTQTCGIYSIVTVFNFLSMYCFVIAIAV